MIWIDKFDMTFFMIQKRTLNIAAGKETKRQSETLLGQSGARRDSFSVPALILIIQKHTSDNAAQMPELRTQVLSGLVLIAVNWCSNTSRHIWSACITARTEGIVKCFTATTVCDYPAALCLIMTDKRTDCN